VVHVPICKCLLVINGDVSYGFSIYCTVSRL
jgi:hypothetical protein